MEALTLTRQEYADGLKKIEDLVETGSSYLDQFSVEFPEGLNTASSLEICRVMQDPSLEARIKLMKICIADKNVKVTCPNGEVESFHLSAPTDSLEGFDLFRKEPLALTALADVVYGHILKKSLRLSRPKGAAAE